MHGNLSPTLPFKPGDDAIWLHRPIDGSAFVLAVGARIVWIDGGKAHVLVAPVTGGLEQITVPVGDLLKPGKCPLNDRKEAGHDQER